MTLTSKVQEREYTLEEYFELQNNTQEKLEFYNGKIKQVPGGSINHNKIAIRVATELSIALDQKKKEYTVFGSDQRIHIEAFSCYVYPDAVVICETIETTIGPSITNPLLIVEVLSKSTHSHDRGPKGV